MSSIQIVSDLHLEAPKSYDVFEIFPVAPSLALIGDIGCVKDPEYFSFLERQLLKFKNVFLIAGNHEPYHSSWATTKTKLKEFEKEMSSKDSVGDRGLFVFMDQTRFDLDPNTAVLGCTLFSNIIPSQNESVSFGLNDFYHIDGWTVEDHIEAYSADLRWLNAQVKEIAEAEPARKIIILTHYSPSKSPEAIDPAHSESKISSGFSTDLSNELCWTSGNVKAWAFGHTHFNCNFIDGGTGKRVLANQRGYYFSQASGFDLNTCIEV